MTYHIAYVSETIEGVKSLHVLPLPSFFFFKDVLTFLISGSLVLTTLGSRTIISNGNTIIITCTCNKIGELKYWSKKQILVYHHTAPIRTYKLLQLEYENHFSYC